MREVLKEICPNPICVDEHLVRMETTGRFAGRIAVCPNCEQTSIVNPPVEPEPEAA